MLDVPIQVQAVMAKIRPVLFAAGGPPIKIYRVDKDQNGWHVWLYPALVEVKGGASDGRVLRPGVMLDVLALLKVFDDVGAVLWETKYGAKVGLGACLAVSGVLDSTKLSIYVLAQAPEDEGPDLVYDAKSKKYGRKSHGK